MNEDRGRLLTRIDMLQAEVERLRADRDRLDKELLAEQKDCAQAEAEVERLRTENADLQERIRRLVDSLNRPTPSHENPQLIAAAISAAQPEEKP